MEDTDGHIFEKYAVNLIRRQTIRQPDVTHRVAIQPALFPGDICQFHGMAGQSLFRFIGGANLERQPMKRLETDRWRVRQRLQISAVRLQIVRMVASVPALQYAAKDSGS